MLLEPNRGRDGNPAVQGPAGLAGQLINGRKKVGIWGLGYLGYHNLVRLLTHHVNCVVTDRVPERLERVAAGDFVGDVLRNHYGFAMAEAGRGWATVEACNETELTQRSDVSVHLVCVPTEKDGQPSDEPLTDVMRCLARATAAREGEALLIVVESSGAPGAIDRIVLPQLKYAGAVVGRDVCVGAAPRTDYGRSPFDSRTDNERIAGGVTPHCSAMLAQFYELMGERIRLASTYREAELACAVNRGAQHLLMSYVNQLALAFGDTNVREVVELAAGTGPLTLHGPGIGSSGYFLPVSANHLRDSADDPEMLTLLDEAFRCDLMMAGVVADRVVKADVKRLAILGLSTVADAKNHIHSPIGRLTRSFRDRLAEVSVCDPFYSDVEIRSLTQCRPIAWLADWQPCDGIVLVTGHRAFRAAEPNELAHRLGHMKLVLDCCGAWTDKGLRPAGVNYFALGQAGWAG